MVTPERSERQPASLRRVTLLIGVREVSLSLVFYRDILGLDIIAEDEHHATLAGDDGIPAVVLQAVPARGNAKNSPPAPIARLVFDPRTFEAIRNRLLIAAIPFRVTQLASAPELTARDLDGNEVIVHAE